MPISPAPDLISIVREFLEKDILPDSNLSDDKRFNIRVALNLLATAERELRLGPTANSSEAVRLAGFVGSEGSLEEKNRRLARAIRERTVAIDDVRLFDHLRQTITDALRINNPKWIEGR